MLYKKMLSTTSLDPSLFALCFQHLSCFLVESMLPPTLLFVAVYAFLFHVISRLLQRHLTSSTGHQHRMLILYCVWGGGGRFGRERKTRFRILDGRNSSGILFHGPSGSLVVVLRANSRQLPRLCTASSRMSTLTELQ